MRLNVQLNSRNLSNAPTAPTFGFKIPIRFIRGIGSIDAGLAAHLVDLSNGLTATYTKDVTLLWPQRNLPPLAVHISYTYTGNPLADGSYSSQAHIAVTDPAWTPVAVSQLGNSLAATYFRGGQRDLIVIAEP